MPSFLMFLCVFWYSTIARALRFPFERVRMFRPTLQSSTAGTRFGTPVSQDGEALERFVECLESGAVGLGFKESDSQFQRSECPDGLR